MDKKKILYIAGFLILVLLVPFLDIDLSVFIMVKHPIFILLTLLTILFSFIVLAFRLKFLLRAAGEKELSLIDSFKVEVTNRFFTYIAPMKLNIPVKAVLLNKRFKVGKVNALAMSSYEYFIDLGILFFFGLLGFLFVFNDFAGAQANMILIVFALLAFIAAFFLVPKHFFGKLEARIQSASENIFRNAILFLVKSLSQMREAWINLFFSRESPAIIFLVFVKFILAIISYIFLFWAVGYDLNFIYILMVISFSMFLGGISTIPSGLGVREGSIVLLLSLFAVPSAFSFFAVVANRLLIIPFLVLGYFFSLQFGVKK